MIQGCFSIGKNAPYVCSAYKMVFYRTFNQDGESFRVFAGKEQVDYSKKEYTQSNVAVMCKSWKWQKKMYQNLELNLDVAIEKEDDLVMDVEIWRMEKKWDEVYEERYKEGI